MGKFPRLKPLLRPRFAAIISSQILGWSKDRKVTHYEHFCKMTDGSQRRLYQSLDQKWKERPFHESRFSKRPPQVAIKYDPKKYYENGNQRPTGTIQG